MMSKVGKGSVKYVQLRGTDSTEQLHVTDNTKQLHHTGNTEQQHMLLSSTCCIVAEQQCLMLSS